MQNFDKTSPPFLYVSANRPKFINRAKEFFWQASPFIFKFVSVGLVLLFLQAVLIGVADLFLRISPKVSFLFSSFFYVFVFSGLALAGGLRRNEVVENEEIVLTNEPVCKILIIKSKV